MRHPCLPNAINLKLTIQIPQQGICCFLPPLYCHHMEIFPVMKPGSLILSFVQEIVPNLIVELALRGPVTVLDGGNCFPAYRIAQLIRRKGTQVDAISKRIFIRRAFTCHQMLNLLETSAAQSQPHVLLDPLATFLDDQIKPSEAGRLFTLCLQHIERIQLSAPVAILLKPVIPAEKEFLLTNLCERADEIFAHTAPNQPREQQLDLFQGL